HPGPGRTGVPLPRGDVVPRAGAVARPVDRPALAARRLFARSGSVFVGIAERLPRPGRRLCAPVDRCAAGRCPVELSGPPPRPALLMPGGTVMSVALNIRTIVSMPFEENTYVVWRPGSREALVIDPGLEPNLILEFLRDEGLNVVAILNTHGHAD